MLPEKDKKHLGRSHALDIEIESSQGCYLYASGGEKYVDFASGWNVGNAGWNSSEINNKIKSFSGPNYVYPHFSYKRWTDLAELLAKIAPGNLQKSFRATGGTEAVEIALQAAMAHTGREKFLSVEGGYHGHSLGALSVGDSSSRKFYKNLLPGCFKISPPLDARAAREAGKILEKEEIAAFILEPIVLNLAVEIPTQEFFDIVQEACRKHGTLLIADEVATGFGRTGKLFACEHYQLKPDIMCLAKALTGGYGVAAAAVMTKEVARSLENGLDYYSTFGWLPISVEAALANIEFILENKLWANARKMGRYLCNKLKKMDFREEVVEIRMKGLAIAVEFENRIYAYELRGKCLQNKLLISSGENSILFFPPLIINKEIADEGLGLLEEAL